MYTFSRRLDRGNCGAKGLPTQEKSISFFARHSVHWLNVKAWNFHQVSNFSIENVARLSVLPFHHSYWLAFLHVQLLQSSQAAASSHQAAASSSFNHVDNSSAHHFVESAASAASTSNVPPASKQKSKHTLLFIEQIFLHFVLNSPSVHCCCSSLFFLYPIEIFHTERFIKKKTFEKKSALSLVALDFKVYCSLFEYKNILTFLMLTPTISIPHTYSFHRFTASLWFTISLFF